MHDAHICVVCIHTPVAQVVKGPSGIDTAVLHEDGGLLELGLERVAVIRFAMKRFGSHDKVEIERAGNAHLDIQLKSVRALPLQILSTLGACQL